MKTYSVTRPDGLIQYATSHDNGESFALYGSGFLIKKFSEGTKVEEIQQVPKSMKGGLVCFDGEYLISRAIWDKNTYWNGWLMPKVLEEDAIKFVEESQKNEDMANMTFKMKDKDIIVSDPDGEEEEYTIFPEEIEGKTYYNLGYLGMCWEEYREEEQEED